MSVQTPDANPGAWPPSIVPAANTTHPSATKQTYVDNSSGALSDGRDVQSLGYDASSGGGSPTYATGATAGIPGSFTPGGSNAPNSSADMIAARPNAVTASPGTNWTAGQYVQTESDKAHWNGSAWVAGAHP